jgi:hypothetical protein
MWEPFWLDSRSKSQHAHDSEITCYSGKKGHIRPDSPDNKPQIFAAQVIDEENESQHHEPKDQPDPNPTDNDQENSRSDEVNNNNNNGKVPIGSQYDLEQEGGPLDEYKEYVKVEDYSDNDEDIVYIRAGQVESVDSEVEDNSGNISDISKVLTLLGGANSSMRHMDIDREMTPHEILTSLSKDIEKTYEHKGCVRRSPTGLSQYSPSS